jgi:hypothetical protein
MKKRLLIYLAFLAICACLVVGLCLLLPNGPRVTEANCCQIRIGMTEPEVEAIFGKPKETTQALRETAKSLKEALKVRLETGTDLDLEEIMRAEKTSRWHAFSEKGFSLWVDVDGAAVVLFDANGKVKELAWFDRVRSDYAKLILRWLHLE